MAGRFVLLLVFMTAATGGCAATSEERLSRMENDILQLQSQEIRLAVLEDTVHKIVMEKNGAPGKSSGAEQPWPGTASVKTSPPPSSPRRPPARTESAGHPGNAAKEYQAALNALEAGNPRAAKELFTKFLASHSGHQLAPNAAYWLGECHYTLGQYESAIIVFKDVVAQFPAHDKASAAMLKAGYSYLELKDAQNARFYFDILVKDYPLSRPASLARAKLTTL